MCRTHGWCRLVSDKGLGGHIKTGTPGNGHEQKEGSSRGGEEGGYGGGVKPS